MEKLRFLILPFCIISIIIFTGCSLLTTERNSGYHIIDVTGSYMVWSLKSTEIISAMAMEEGDTLSLAVLEGDLLLLSYQDFEPGLFYRYRAEDGKALSFLFDSINPVCYLNGELISIDLSDESGGWKWLEQQDEELFSSIRSLSLSLPVGEGELEALERIARTNPGPGLYLSGKGTAAPLFDIFSPEWIFIDDDIPMERATGKARSNLSGTELFGYYCSDSAVLDILYNLPGIQSLILGSCNSDVLTNIPFEELPALRSLCIIDSDIPDLSFLGSQEVLQYLDLVDCEYLTNIEILKNFRNLKCVGILECDNIQDIEIIREIPQLERLGLPSAITQADLSDIISGQPSLKVLELINCQDITDLSPLQGLSQLKALTIDIENIDLNPVYGMRNLELLTLQLDYFEDSLQMDVLKRALPDTRIVPGGTLCLGSGWLILLIPMIIMLVALKRWKEAGS